MCPPCDFDSHLTGHLHQQESLERRGFSWHRAGLSNVGSVSREGRIGIGRAKAVCAQCIVLVFFLGYYRLFGGNREPPVSADLWPSLASFLCP